MLLMEPMSQHLLMLGGGHAHLPLLRSAADINGEGHHVTLVSPEPEHYYSAMGPGMLGGSYAADDARFPIREMAEASGVRWVRDRAVRIRPLDRIVELAGGESLSYDVLSVNTGSSVAPTVAVDRGPGGGPRVFTAKPVSGLFEARRYVDEVVRRMVEGRRPGEPEDEEGELRIAVVGGGPSAVEIAANVRRLVRSLSAVGDERTGVDLYAADAILRGLSGRAARIARRALQASGVRLHECVPVRRVAPEGVVTATGVEPADLVLLATGVVPSRLYRDSQLPVGPDGSLAVNEYLHCLGHRSVFGAGDCIWYTPRPLARAGVYAVRQSSVLVHNVRAALSGRYDRLRRFVPGGGYMLLLNLGDETALLWRRVLGVPIVVRARWAWRLKRRIDRAFMQKHGSGGDRGNEY